MESIKKIWLFLLSLALSSSFIWLLFNTPLFTNYGSVQTARLYEMNECFQDNQIPCRWVPGLENFYGSPIFNYLPPLPYYFGEFIFYLTNSLSVSVKIVSLMSLIGGYVFIYLMTYKILGISKASLLAIAYMTVLLLVIIFYKEGLGVAWGLMFLPLIILSLNLFFKNKQIQYFLFATISLLFLILSADFALLLIGLLIIWIFYNYIKSKNFQILLLGFVSIVFASLLSSFYFFPSILENNLVHNTFVNEAFHYLPISATEEPKRAANSAYQILTGDSDIVNFTQGTNWLNFETNTRTHTIIRLSQFYFPNWKIFIDGKEAEVEYKNNSLGLMTIILGEGRHTVEGRLFDTPIRVISNIMTVISVILILILCVGQLKGARNWINYYRKRVN